MTMRARLGQPQILIAPGVYDGLTAAIATDAGFEALYLSGAAVAYTRLGRPDIGLSTASEMADTMALIADRTDLPVIMDADTGFGNALNARRTILTYERAGAAAVQIEDQTYPKRCGHLSDKSLISAVEIAGKIAALPHNAKLNIELANASQTIDAFLWTKDKSAMAGFMVMADRKLGFYATRIKPEAAQDETPRE